MNSGTRRPLLNHLLDGSAVVPTPEYFVEVSLKVLAAQVMIDTDKGALHLGDYGLCGIDVGAGLGFRFVAMLGYFISSQTHVLRRR